MKYQNTISAFYSQPLALLPAKLAEIRAFLRLKAMGGDVAPEEIAAVAGSRRSDGVQMIGRVAVLPIMGVISQRVGMMERASGGVSTEEIGATLDSLVADKQVSSILLAFDSPGGSVAGVPELAAKIRAAKGEKRVVAIADTLMASAAFWLAAQANEVVATPSSQVGSVGVVAAHDDITGMLEKEGVKTTLVTSSQFKAETFPEVPLSEEAKAALQASVNHYHGMFVADLAKGRGITENAVEKNFGKGRMMVATDAKANGLVDRIATVEDTIRRMGGTSQGERNARARDVSLIEAGIM